MQPKAWVEAVLELIWRVVRAAVFWGLLLYFLFRVRSVIVAILISAVLTYAVLPLIDFLCAYRVRGMSRRFQRVLATLLVFVSLATVFIVLVVAFFSPLQAELVGLVQNFESYLAQAKNLALGAQKWYTALHPDVQNFLRTQDFNGIVERLSKWTSSVISSTFDFLSHLVDIILIPVLAFYFALDSRTLKREFVALVPKARSREALAILHEINCIMRSYVIGQIILCVIAGVVVGLVLSAADMQYVLILSVFAGITRAIPVIGPIISGIVIVLLAMVKSPLMGLNILIFFAFLHFAESKFIMPKLIGHRMQLHPALVIIVLLIGAEFFGIIGMFLAAPVAAILRVLVRYYLIKPKELRVWGLKQRGQCNIELDERAEAPTNESLTECDKMAK